MGNWTFKLEIDDNVDVNLVLDTLNMGFMLILKERNESVITIPLRDINNNLDTKIVNGKEIRIYGNHNAAATTKRFTGTIIKRQRFFTSKETFKITGKDFFKDSIQTSVVNKKFPDQNNDVTVKDIVQNFLNKTFTVTNVLDIGIAQPYNAIKENAEHLLDRIANSSFSEYYGTADKDVTFRTKETKDSGLTITDSNIKNLSVVALDKSLLESFGIIEVVGGLDVSSNRIIARRIIPNAPTNIARRVFTKIDERFTTYKGCKQHAITLALDFGKEFTIIPPLEVKNLTDLPLPGELININSTTMGITNTKFVVKEIGIRGEPGEDTVKFFTMKIGDSEQTERKKLVLLKEIFEDEKRKALDVDTFTSQKTFTGVDAVTLGSDTMRVEECTGFRLDGAGGGHCAFTLDMADGSELDV